MTVKTTKEVCPQCGEAFKTLIMHWAKSSNCKRQRVPEDLFEFWRGCATVRGGFLSPGTSPYNLLSFTTAYREKLLTLRRASGVFGQPSIDESKFDSSLDEGKYILYQWSTSPHPMITAELLFKSGYTATPWFLSGILHVGSRKRGERYIFRVNKDRIEWVLDSLRDLNPNEISWINGSGFEAPETGRSFAGVSVKKDQFDKMTHSGIPTGWWNDDIRGPIGVSKNETSRR